MALSTIGVKFYMGAAAATPTYTEVANLQSFPDFFPTRSSIDVTTLANENRTYIQGVREVASNLDFTFLYDNSESTSNFRQCRAAETSKALQAIKIEFPDVPSGSGEHHGSQFTFNGYVSVGVVGKGVNEALQFTLSVAPNTDITVTDPA